MVYIERNNTTTTIRIRHDTKNKLEFIGRKNQSFDNIISSLIQEHSSTKRQIQLSQSPLAAERGGL